MELTIAIWGAVLSTLLGILQLVKWCRDGPRVLVEIINPLEVARIDKRAIEIVIFNTGTVPTVVKKLEVAFHETKNMKKSFKEVRFDHAMKSWDPSLRTASHPTKPGTNIWEVEVIAPGHEIYGLINPPQEYNPAIHWLKAHVTLRNSSRTATGWAPPVSQEANK